nr:LCP family protein [Saccharopolyspora sp. HNM0983]
MVGVDAAEPGSPAEFEPGAQRSDVVMLVHVSADRSSVGVVSLPRDLWVEVPGAGRNKLNASFGQGGIDALHRTVAALTGVRPDHYAVVGFDGFRALTDAVGGVEVDVDEPSATGEHRFDAGTNHFDGERALAYVRQRSGLEGGDLDRARRQQDVLQALSAQVLSRDTATDPGRLFGVLEAFGRHATLDAGLSNARIRDLAWQMRGVRPADVQLLTAPVAGSGQEDGQSVVHPDEERAGQLWDALREDALQAYADRFPDAVRGGAG